MVGYYPPRILTNEERQEAGRQLVSDTINKVEMRDGRQLGVHAATIPLTDYYQRRKIGFSFLRQGVEEKVILDFFRRYSSKKPVPFYQPYVITENGRFLRHPQSPAFSGLWQNWQSTRKQKSENFI